MGCTSSRSKLFSTAHITIAMLGLDNAGKSSIVNNLTTEYYALVTPTLGFSHSTFIRALNDVTIFDLGGSPSIRGYWTNYYHELYGIIIVIDSTDTKRMSEIRGVLHEALAHQLLVGKPVLIFANKQDLPKAMTAEEVRKILHLDKITHSVIRIQPCIALVRRDEGIKGPGVIKPDANITAGIDWLIDCVSKQYQSLKTRIQNDTEEWTQKEGLKKEKQRQRVKLLRAEREAEKKGEKKEMMNSDSSWACEDTITDEISCEISLGSTQTFDDISKQKIVTINQIQ